MGCSIPPPLGPGGEARGTIRILSPYDQPIVPADVFRESFTSPLLPSFGVMTTSDGGARFPWGIVALLGAVIAYLYLERRR